jgi:hydroxymethylpyrimidine/phosphomethylpyrimidine kinase
VKLGMLGSHELAHVLAGYFSSVRIPIITDPVFMTSTGASVVDDELMDAYIHEIFPISSLVTPNALETERITGLKVDGPETAKEACKIFMDKGPGSVLVKGGHFRNSIGTDVFCDQSGCQLITGKHFEVKVRGTGCTYSSLIAGNVGTGMEVLDAIRKAKEDMERALSQAKMNRSSYLTFHRESDASPCGCKTPGMEKKTFLGGSE